MRYLIVLIFGLFLSTTLMAKSILFECKTNPKDEFHTFYANGKLDLLEDNSFLGQVYVRIQKGIEDQSVQIFDEVKVSGIIKNIEIKEKEEEISKFDQLAIKLDHAYLKSMTINLDIKLPDMSNLVSIDNFIFRSNCMSITE